MDDRGPPPWCFLVGGPDYHWGNWGKEPGTIAPIGGLELDDVPPTADAQTRSLNPQVRSINPRRTGLAGCDGNRMALSEASLSWGSRSECQDMLMNVDEGGYSTLCLHFRDDNIAQVNYPQ